MLRKLSRPGVMVPYQPQYEIWEQRLRAAIRGIFVISLSFLVGASVALLPPHLLVLPALPVIVLLPFIFWLLPDKNVYPDRAITFYFTLSIVLAILWPRYLAFDIPGLPWITIARAVSFGVVILVVYVFSTSRDFRESIIEVLNVDKFVKWMFILFLSCQAFSALLSGSLDVIARFINNQIFWTLAFLVAGYCCRRPASIDRAMKALLYTTGVICVIALLEFHEQHIIWRDYIHIFNVDAELMGHILDANNARIGSDKYRTHATFVTPLELAEYLALASPFVCYYISYSKTLLGRTLASGLLLGCLISIWATDSRLGMVGFLLAIFLYMGIAAFQKWREDKSSLIAAATLFLLPVIVPLLVGALFSSHRVYVAVFGGAQHANSDDGRHSQWEMTFPKVASWPFGHGPGVGGVALGYHSPAGILTVDSYYITLLMDYGIVGFLSFMMFFMSLVWLGIRQCLQSPSGSPRRLAGPAALALLNFVVIKSVLSQESNHFLAFCLAGMVAALCRDPAADVTINREVLTK